MSILFEFSRETRPALFSSQSTKKVDYPDFLWSVLEPMSLMRLSVKKAVYADLARAAYRKSGLRLMTRVVRLTF
jgi:hypothetical protein